MSWPHAQHSVKQNTADFPQIQIKPYLLHLHAISLLQLFSHYFKAEDWVAKTSVPALDRLAGQPGD